MLLIWVNRISSYAIMGGKMRKIVQTRSLWDIWIQLFFPPYKLSWSEEFGSQDKDFHVLEGPGPDKHQFGSLLDVGCPVGRLDAFSPWEKQTTAGNFLSLTPPQSSIPFCSVQHNAKKCIRSLKYKGSWDRVAGPKIKGQGQAQKRKWKS